MRRLRRHLVLAAQVCVAAVVTLLVGIQYTLIPPVHGQAPLWGQAKPSTAATTNGTRGAKPYTTWTTYSGGAHSSQYSALTQINKANVSQLEVAWTFPVTGTVIFNPLDRRQRDVPAGAATTRWRRSIRQPARRLWRKQMPGTASAPAG